ncbi:MAG: HAMP domain-containing protein [Chloroflexi bacterium]|nr:HAMP domain-containing protein [Chloroflexota bacterium]
MVGLFGDQRVIAVVPTPKHGWVLGVSIPVDMALAPVDRSLRRTLAILVAVVALTTGLSLWLADFLSRPVKQLTENAVALGRGDLRRRVKIATRDEVEDLANAFNWMAGALADKEAQLRDHAARLEQINRELEGFSYSVSHDLRAPLRAIDGFSHALLEDYADKLDEQGKGYLDRVRAASQRMAQLIDDLLSLSRLTRSEVRREQVDLSALVGTIAAELRQTEPERQVEFVIAEGLVAMGDTRLLRVALENLLGNAWKFTGKHPSARIEFGVVEQDGKPAYFVRDDGAGFDMAYADRLFGAFQRLHTPMEFPGSGIGLATVQRIIHRHGGDVWAEGAVEQGATFYFTL